MANRFIRLIEEGTIASEGELKSAFRAHALATHPDLGTGTGHTTRSPGEEFMKARAEYEAAVRYLAPRSEAGAPVSGTVRTGRNRFDRKLFHADLAALLKAGFPKTARHDKERRKYARLRLNVRSCIAAWDRESPGSRLAQFDAFEHALSALRDGADPVLAGRLALVLGLLEDILDYAVCGIVPLRASIEIEFAGLRQAAPDQAILAFLSTLAGDMEGGIALG